ncbi:MAG: carbohydrate ABC transporter permease [Tessaracoccus sp.]|uniref:carbohydrate ABC transporter permease n=1 Tax=Tessaracoccus sp. TaxID=1971211 RepID=UPI001ED568A1|nr:carbohydrate ABC transporter permease [Tessaracoccus sp.]MBK7819961.1 carbohydrate ABC transporter permease [Tessaracoccus sp.]
MTAAPPEPRASRSNRSIKASGRLAQAVVLILLIGGAVFALGPFLWLIRSSLMDQVQIFTSPPKWIPDPVVWSNYPDALAAAPFGRYLLNTLNIIVMVVPGTLLSCSAAAFAFSRLQWRGRNLFFGLLMTGMMLPYAVTLIPTFIAWQKLGFVDTYVPLTIPAFFAAGGAFNIFMLRQFFLTIPNDLDNAVYIDGGSPWTVYWRVILPLNKGPLTLVAVFTIIAAWNDLLNPLIYLSDPDKATLSLGLAAFRGLYNSQWGLLMAASVMVITPLLVLFFFAQRQIMEGIALTGVKG